jgi:hypothetical protein
VILAFNALECGPVRGIGNLESERSFRLFVVVVFALLAGFNYLPVIVGKVPFPRDIVLQFPAWNGAARFEPWQPYADIGDLITSFYPFRAFASRAGRSSIPGRFTEFSLLPT